MEVDEELRAPNIIRMIQSRHVARMEKCEMHTKCYFENLEG